MVVIGFLVSIVVYAIVASGYPFAYIFCKIRKWGRDASGVTGELDFLLWCMLFGFLLWACTIPPAAVWLWHHISVSVSIRYCP